MTVSIHKAQAIDQPAPDLRIEAVTELPRDTRDAATHAKWIEDRRETFRAEAKALVTALLTSLPGGTIDAILVELLEHRASVLRVPHAAPNAQCSYGGALPFTDGSAKVSSRCRSSLPLSPTGTAHGRAARFGSRLLKRRGLK